MPTFDSSGREEHRKRSETTEQLHAELMVKLFDALSKVDTCLNVEELDLLNEENELTDFISRVADDWMLQILCNFRPELVQSVIKDLADFIEQTRQGLENFTDLENEYEQLKALKERKPLEFLANWSPLHSFLQQNYSEYELNLDFYDSDVQRFKQDEDIANVIVNILEKNEYENEQGDLNFEKENTPDDIEDVQFLKEHLQEAWTELLRQKEQSQTLKALSHKTEKYAEDLNKKIMKYQKIHNNFTELSEETSKLWDLAEGKWRKSDFKLVGDFLRRLKKDKNLLRLAEMMGRHRKMEVQEYEEKFVNKEEWISFAVKTSYTGLRQSDDLDSVLPSEIALLGDPATEGLFMKRLAEKKLQTFDYQNSFMDSRTIRRLEKVPKRDKGPFILCVDTSASMQGMPERAAKMLCLAILKIALKEKRPCYLISFSIGVSSIDLTNLKNSSNALLQFLRHSFKGGTDLHPALRETLEVLQTDTFRKADVLVISDFELRPLDVKMMVNIEKAKEQRTKFYSILVQQRPKKLQFLEQFKHLFDHNWHYNPKDPNAALEIIQELEEEERKNMSE